MTHFQPQIPILFSHDGRDEKGQEALLLVRFNDHSLRIVGQDAITLYPQVEKIAATPDIDHERAVYELVGLPPAASAG